jgi:hypothetical protein
MDLCRRDKPAVSSKCDLHVKEFGAKKGKGVITAKLIQAGQYVLGMNPHAIRPNVYIILSTQNLLFSAFILSLR